MQLAPATMISPFCEKPGTKATLDLARGHVPLAEPPVDAASSKARNGLPSVAPGRDRAAMRPAPAVPGTNPSPADPRMIHIESVRSRVLPSGAPRTHHAGAYCASVRLRPGKRSSARSTSARPRASRHSATAELALLVHCAGSVRRNPRRFTGASRAARRGTSCGVGVPAPSFTRRAIRPRPRCPKSRIRLPPRARCEPPPIAAHESPFAHASFTSTCAAHARRSARRAAAAPPRPPSSVHLRRIRATAA